MSRKAPTADHVTIDQEISQAITRVVQRAVEAALAAQPQAQQQKPQKLAALPPPAPKAAVDRSHNGPRGMPPPPSWNFNSLPDEQLLTENEVASVCRLSPNTLATWRGIRGHPLRWQHIANGSVRYRVADVRLFLATSKRSRRAGHPPARPRTANGTEVAHKPQANAAPVPAQDDRSMESAQITDNTERFERIERAYLAALDGREPEHVNVLDLLPAIFAAVPDINPQAVVEALRKAPKHMRAADRLEEPSRQHE